MGPLVGLRGHLQKHLCAAIQVQILVRGNHQRPLRRVRRGCINGFRVKAPPGIGAVQTSSGRHITIGVDGIVEMSEADAFYLTPCGWTILGDAA